MPTLGESSCNECEGGKRKLIFNSRGIWSKCFRCGFTEWEWTWGDNPEYLKYLAENYHVDINQIYEALKQVH